MIRSATVDGKGAPGNMVQRAGEDRALGTIRHRSALHTAKNTQSGDFRKRTLNWNRFRCEESPCMERPMGSRKYRGVRGSLSGMQRFDNRKLIAGLLLTVSKRCLLRAQ
jgi:hypothetical protein